MQFAFNSSFLFQSVDIKFKENTELPESISRKGILFNVTVSGVIVGTFVVDNFSLSVPGL